MTSSSRAVLREMERQQGQEQSAPENAKVFAGRAGFATKVSLPSLLLFSFCALGEMVTAVLC
jgi:hypothetical protein